MEQMCVYLEYKNKKTFIRPRKYSKERLDEFMTSIILLLRNLKLY